MPFKDYSPTPGNNNVIGDGLFIGPNMDRNNVRPALQQFAADGRELVDAVVPIGERAGRFLSWNASGKAIAVSGTGVDGGFRTDIASPDPDKGAALVGFKQDGAGAVDRNLKERGQETLSVFDFIPANEHAAIRAGTTTTDVTSFISAAIAAAKATAFNEKRLTFPSGTYRVSQLDLRDCNYFTLHGEGTVQIIGIDGSKKWIVGDDRLDEFGHLETFTRSLRFTGGPWLIGPAAGQNYARAWKLQNFVDCVFENVSVSGVYTPVGGTGDRTPVEIDLSFNNAFYDCSFGYPGAPIGSNKSYCAWIGSDNANNNRFFNCRAVGAGASVANTVGFHVESSGNCFYGIDISAIHTCFELRAARGCHFINTYHEAVSRVCNVVFASRGCVFMPSYVELASNGTAYDLGGSDGTVQTIGFQIIGGNHKFSATGTTLLKKGANCYGLNFQPGIDTTSPPTTTTTGTDRGSGGATAFDGFEQTAAKINFPDTPIPSNNPTTLDCYKEGTWTPVYRDATMLGWSGTGSPTATYIKIGKLVTLFLRFSIGVETLASVREIGGLPFPPDASKVHGVAIGEQVNPNGFAWRLDVSGGAGFLYPIDPVANSDRTPNQLSNTKFAMAITYQAAS